MLHEALKADGITDFDADPYLKGTSDFLKIEGDLSDSYLSAHAES